MRNLNCKSKANLTQEKALIDAHEVRPGQID